MSGIDSSSRLALGTKSPLRGVPRLPPRAAGPRRLIYWAIRPMVSDAFSRVVAPVFPGLATQPVVQFEAVLVIAAMVAGRRRRSLRWFSQLLERASRRPSAAFAACAALALV